ncbi:MAG: CDP-diacylglycerol--serine O-phosphatidyltransferase, partial [Gammaproteobacteria bacterium]|nr:CDP-diacylglycerol--serine O-phosphatidyltransferase [Gammaproteobacteria bacterium]
YGVPGKEVSFVALAITVFAAAAMVSNIRYYSFKTISFRERVPFFVVLVGVLTFVLISYDPPQVLFMIFLGYGLSGPLAAMIRLYRRRGSQRTS